MDPVGGQVYNWSTLSGCRQGEGQSLTVYGTKIKLDLGHKACMLHTQLYSLPTEEFNICVYVHTSVCVCMYECVCVFTCASSVFQVYWFFHLAVFINAVFEPHRGRASLPHTLGEYLGFLGTSVKDFSS